MRHTLVLVVQKPPHTVNAASPAILFHCVNFPCRVRCYPHTMRNSECFCGSLQVFPNRLSCAMFIHIKPMFKHPHRPSLPPQSSDKGRVKPYFEPLMCFLLCDCHSLRKFRSSELQHVRHTQPRAKRHKQNKPILSRQGCKDMRYNVLIHIVRFYDTYPLSVPVNRRTAAVYKA